MIFDTCTLNGRGIDPLKMDADKESLVVLPVSWLWRDEGWDLFSPGRITAVGTWLSEPSFQAHDDGNCLFGGGGMNVRHLQIRFRDGSVSAPRSVILKEHGPSQHCFYFYLPGMSCWVGSVLNNTPNSPQFLHSPTPIHRC